MYAWQSDRKVKDFKICSSLLLKLEEEKFLLQYLHEKEKITHQTGPALVVSWCLILDIGAGSSKPQKERLEIHVPLQKKWTSPS